MKAVKRRQKVVIWIVVGGFVASIVAAGGLGLLGSPQAEGQEEIVLVADGRRTTRQEFSRAYDNLIANFRQLYAAWGMDFEPLLQGTEGAFRSFQFQAQAAEGIIRLVILDQAARELRVTIPRAELDAAVAEQLQTFLTQRGLTEAQFEELLRFQRLTLDGYKRDLRAAEESRLRAERVRQVVVGPVEPTEADLVRYFEENRTRYQTDPEQIRVGHILVRDARLADQLVAAVGAPAADLAALAQAHSLDETTRGAGGQTALFARGESPFSPDVTDTIWPLEVGQVRLVQDDDGFHIVKVLERQAAAVPEFATVRDRVRSDYVREEVTRRWDEWYQARRERVEVEALYPILAAAMVQREDSAAALATLEAAWRDGTSDDPHLTYYVGRLHEELRARAAARRVELEGMASRTAEEEAELVRLRAEEANHTERAIAAYTEFIEAGNADDPFFQRLLALAPGSAEARYALAEMHRQAGRWFPAEAEYRRAIEARPNFVEAHIGLGDVLMALGLYRQASEAYRRALDLQPGNVTLSLKLAAAYVRDNQFALAQALLQDVLSRDPNNATALTLSGDVLLAQGDTAGAIARYETAYARSRAADPLLKLAAAHLAAGQTDLARARYQDAVRRFPHRAEGHLGLGDVLLARGEPEQALASYHQALRRAVTVSLQETTARRIVDLDPTDVRTRYLLAGYLREQYKYDGAIRQYEEILRLSPANLDALIGLGDSHQARAEHDRALDYYRQALGVAPTARRRLAIYDEMVRVEERRVGAGRPLGPQGLEFLWQRVQLHQELGQPDRAIANLERIAAADATFRAEEVTSLLATLRARQVQ